MAQPAQARMASDIAARYPSVTAEELEHSRQTLEPLLGRLLHPENIVVAGAFAVSGVILGATSFLVLVISIVSSIAVPGGAATRMIGLAVVTRDGIEIGRGRSLARTLIAWVPIFVGLIMLPGSEHVLGLDSAVKLCLSIAFGGMIAGVVWTIAAADRGPHDRIAGTWVVPR